MPKIIKKKEDAIYRNAKPKEKPYKISDGDGLHILIRPTGSKVWQMLYTHSGKNKTYTFGPYPEISTKKAREMLIEAKALLRDGIDPNAVKQTRRMENMGQSETTFEAVAREWLDKQVWNPKYKKRVISGFESSVFPKIGHVQIDKVTPQNILVVLKTIEDRGALDVAKRTNQHCSAVFDYGIVHGFCEMNPAHGRAKFVKSYKTQHRPHLRENQLPEFLNQLDCYSGSRLVQLAMKLSGKTLQCYQSGKEIIHEVGLQSYEETPTRIKAKRLDGSTFEVLLFSGAEIACTVITRSFQSKVRD